MLSAHKYFVVQETSPDAKPYPLRTEHKVEQELLDQLELGDYFARANYKVTRVPYCEWKEASQNEKHRPPKSVLYEAKENTVNQFEEIWRESKSLKEGYDASPDSWWLKNVLSLLRRAERTLEERGGDSYIDEYLAIRKVIDDLSEQ
jgi:hypothetical protein